MKQFLNRNYESLAKCPLLKFTSKETKRSISLAMSFSEIEQGVPLQDSDIFLHSSILKPQIEKFRDNFERNQRHKEFDGLIRRNHRIYEANELFPHLKTENLGKLLENLNKVEQRLKLLTEIKFTPNELSKVDLSNLSQMDIMKLAEAKLQECIPVERLDVIRETSAEE